MSDKVNKILIVEFLTLLIWTWAYMSQEKDYYFTGTLEVASATDPSLLVTFSLSGSGQETRIPLTSLTLKASPSRISTLLKRHRLPLNHPDKERLDFYYDPQEQGRGEGTYPLDLLDFLRKNSKTRELGLTLESVTPSEVTVQVEQLINKKLPVQCLNENGGPIPGAIPEPAMVNVYVRQGFNESATVTLTGQQIDLARNRPVTVRPYVNIGVANEIRESQSPVSITIPNEERLKPRYFQTSKPIGIIMSTELQANYRVTISNDDEIRKNTYLFATEEAFAAYQNVDYPFLIEVRQSDVINLSQIPPKRIIYNFPSEFVRSGEIELDDSKVSVLAEITIEEINGALTP